VIIREFLAIYESGTVLFHRRYVSSKDKSSTDIILRSGLISALYNYTSEVEKDALDFIKMEKVTLFFKKRFQLLFVLFLESSFPTVWCEAEFDELLSKFFELFPEIILNQDVVDVRLFERFLPHADFIINNLSKKLELLMFLIEDELMTEEEHSQTDNLNILGKKVGIRILNRNHDIFQHILLQGDEAILEHLDHIIAMLLGDHHISRENTTFSLECTKCFLCPRGDALQDCFFSGLLNTIINQLDRDYHIRFLSTSILGKI